MGQGAWDTAGWEQCGNCSTAALDLSSLVINIISNHCSHRPDLAEGREILHLAEITAKGRRKSKWKVGVKEVLSWPCEPAPQKQNVLIKFCSEPGRDLEEDSAPCQRLKGSINYRELLSFNTFIKDGLLSRINWNHWQQTQKTTASKQHEMCLALLCPLASGVWIQFFPDGTAEEAGV